MMGRFRANEVKFRSGVLSPPVDLKRGPSSFFFILLIVRKLAFPIIQYANDTLIIMKGYIGQLYTLKALLNTFANSTRLMVNYSKSNAGPHQHA